MRKPKAIAIAAHKNVFEVAFTSAAECLKLVGDFMYGTEKRKQATYLFCAGLLVLGYCLDKMAPVLQVCLP